MVNLIAFDPGGDGGIAILSKDRSIVHLADNTKVEADSIKLIKELVSTYQPKIAVIESVHSFAGQGTSSTFTFGERFGLLKGCLLTLGIPIILVSSKKWQSGIGLNQPPNPVAGEDEKQKRSRMAKRRKEQKRRSLEFASRLFPTVAVTEKNADGLCIAEWAIREPGLLFDQSN